MRRLELGLLAQLAARHLEGRLPVAVAQPGGQLHEAVLHRVPVLPQAEHPVLVVDREHDDGAGVLEHQPGERLVVGVPGAPDAVRAQRHHPAVAVHVGAVGHRPGLGPVGQ